MGGLERTELIDVRQRSTGSSLDSVSVVCCFLKVFLASLLRFCTLFSPWLASFESYLFWLRSRI